MMKTFLEYVAEDLVSKQGFDLSRTALVFPNKRASLFINEHLARLAKQPIWSPAYLTISDLFRAQSPGIVADPLKLVSDLYKTFVGVTGSEETLDHFFGWGQILLSDFDDIDKNMAETDRVFANIRDLHELDDLSYLTEEQRAVIQHFFSNFNPDGNSELKQRFLNLWQHLPAIYRRFRQRLASQQLAYEGMMYRAVVEREAWPDDYDTYVFVGFNLLHQVEQRLFRGLQRAGRAKFYWDFDDYYMHGHEAGYYIAQYLYRFPNELNPARSDIFQGFRQPKDIHFVSAATENIQAHYITDWLSHPQRKADGKHTAILLCDEGLLPAVVHCIPDGVDKLNITTGYPLAATPIASLLPLLVAWQQAGQPAFHYKALRRHPYSPWISDELLHSCEGTDETTVTALLEWLCRVTRTVAVALSKQETVGGDTAALRSESLFRAYTLVNRLKTLAAEGDLNVNHTTLQRLLRQLLQSTTVPFHGEPAEGIQIMGILESRNLDFDHVVLLSCNEGNMPKGISDSSFIPQSLRKAYGLTTVEHKTAIYAYYFHRLLQRARDITLVYNNGTDDAGSREMSRFMVQLMVESPHTVHHHYLKAGQDTQRRQPQPVEKTPEVVQILLQRFSKKPDTDRALLTPTAINNYRACPLRFFYRYVSDLREWDDEELQIDDRLFGLVFHEAAQRLYGQLTSHGRRIGKAQIELLLQSKTAVPRAVDEAFHNQLSSAAFHGQLSSADAYSGLQLINREVIIHYVRQLLTIDLRQAPFEVYGLEREVVCDWPVDAGELHFTTTLGGIIDRLDAVDCDALTERIRVVDYKTGGGRLKPVADVSDIFSDSDPHRGYYLQTLVYSSIVAGNTALNPSRLPVSPALLFIQHAQGEDYDPTLCFGKEPIRDATPSLDEFQRQLKEVIERIFNPEEPFSPSPDTRKCVSCPYAKLCNASV